METETYLADGLMNNDLKQNSGSKADQQTFVRV